MNFYPVACNTNLVRWEQFFPEWHLMNAKHTSTIRMEQLVDWSAAIWAGIIGGTIFLLLNFFVIPIVEGGNGWVMIRLLASIPLTESVLPPPATYDLGILLAALCTHYTLSILFALLVAYVLHRGGIFTGMLGGAIFGLALYFINFYTLTVFFPWFFGYRSLTLIGTHVLFGAICGGIYEGLEVEEFVAVGDDVEANP